MSGSIFARTLRLVVWATFLAVGLSCSKRVTQIVVRIEAAPQIYRPYDNAPELLQSVRVTVQREGASSAFHDASYRVNAAADGDAGLVNLPGSLTILPRDPEDRLPVTITVTGQLGLGGGSIQQTFLLAFQPETTLFVRFPLTADCANRMCNPLSDGNSRTCRFGECVRQDQPHVSTEEPAQIVWALDGAMDAVFERTFDAHDEGMVTPPRPDRPLDIVDAGLDSEVMDVRDLPGEMDVHDDGDRSDIQEEPIPIEDRMDADVVDADVGDEVDARDVRDSHVIEEDSPIDLPTPSMCDSGETPCPGGCFNTASNIMHCGRCNSACSIPNTLTECVLGTCAVSGCVPGFANCDTTMRDCETELATSATHCGACSNRCPSAPNAAPVCEGGTCGLRCESGYVLRSGVCEPNFPRPLGPLSGTFLSGSRPTLRWISIAGETETLVRICRDRGCSVGNVAVNEIVRDGATTFTPLASLPVGRYFWTLSSRRPDSGLSFGTSSPPWQFTVSGTAVRSNAVGIYPDYNGDGYGDLAVGVSASGIPSKLLIFEGGPSGLPLMRTYEIIPADCPTGGGFRPIYLGDINGDGYSDIGGVCTERPFLFLGGPLGFRGPQMIPANVQFEAAAGDFNGDGYGDVIGLTRDVRLRDGGSPDSAVTVYYGSPNGFSNTRFTSLRLPAGTGTFAAIVGGADLNGDGRTEVAYGAYTPGACSSTRVGVYFGPSAIPPPDELAPIRELFVSDSGCGGPRDALAWLDANGDGDVDLAAANPGWSGTPPTTAMNATGRVYIYYGSGGTLPTTTPSGTQVLSRGDPNSFFGSRLVSPGDVDGNGFMDLLVTNRTGDAWYLYQGSMSGLTSVTVTPDPHSAFTSVGPVNADEYPDIGAVSTNGSASFVLLYRGARMLSAAPSQRISLPMPDAHA